MKIIIKASFLFFLFFKSSFIFANTYDDCIPTFNTYAASLACSNGFICELDVNYSPGSFAVHRIKNGVNYGYVFICGYTGNNSCPAGKVRLTPSSYCSSSCVSPMVIDPVTNQCVIPPKRECVIPENPVTADCKYPDNKGNGINCTDGTTVYVPMVCPATFWDNFFSYPGQSRTCSDGAIATFPSTCFDKCPASTILSGLTTITRAGFS